MPISTISMKERSTGDQIAIDYIKVRVLIIERQASLSIHLRSSLRDF